MPPAMIELVLILFGAQAVQRKWPFIGFIGLIWMAIGLFFFINAFTGEARIASLYFVLPLALDGALSLAAVAGSSGAGKSLRYTKAAAFILIAVLVAVHPRHGEMIVGLLVGTFLVADAGLRAAGAYVVRFHAWRRVMVYAGIEFLLGLWSFLPWPSHWRGEIGSDIGLLLMVSACSICGFAWRLAWLPPGISMSRIVTEGLRHLEPQPRFMKAPASDGVSPLAGQRI